MPQNKPEQLERRLRGNVWVELDEQACQWLLQWLAGGNAAGRKRLDKALGVVGEDPALLKAAFASLDKHLFREGRLDPKKAGVTDLEREATQRRFRQLIKAFHPDRFAELSEWLTPRSQAIHDAYAAFKRGESPIEEDRQVVATQPPPVVRRKSPVKDEGPFWAAFFAEWRNRMGRVRSLPQLILGAVAVLAALPVMILLLVGDGDAPSVDWKGRGAPSVPNLVELAGPVPGFDEADPPAPETPWWYRPSAWSESPGSSAPEAPADTDEPGLSDPEAERARRFAARPEIPTTAFRAREEPDSRRSRDEAVDPLVLDRLLASMDGDVAGLPSEVVGGEVQGTRRKEQGARSEDQGARREVQGEGDEVQGARRKEQGPRREVQGERDEEETGRLMERWLVFLEPDFRPEPLPGGEFDRPDPALDQARVLVAGYSGTLDFGLAPLVGPARQAPAESEPGTETDDRERLARWQREEAEAITTPEAEPDVPGEETPEAPALAVVDADAQPEHPDAAIAPIGEGDVEAPESGPAALAEIDPEPSRAPEAEIERLLDGYRQSIVDGDLSAFLDHFTGEPRENANQGREWFAQNYGRLFAQSRWRRFELEIDHVEPAAHISPGWTVEARYRLEVAYGNRQRSSSGQTRYTIEKYGGDWKIAVIEH